MINTKIQIIYFFTIRYTVFGRPAEGGGEGSSAARSVETGCTGLLQLPVAG